MSVRKFFVFEQNNSGGKFIINEDLSHIVFIEADSVGLANRKAEEIGIYFDGVYIGKDCACCGDRWKECHCEEDLFFPNKRFKNITDYFHRTYGDFYYEAVIYYKDGTKKRLEK